jgi:aminopeptidase N
MKKGISLYFKQFQYLNTSLQDFINCLKKILQEKGNEFNLNGWVESWLSKSGVNELTSKVSRNREDGSFDISIMQSLPRFGDPVYHE